MRPSYIWRSGSNRYCVCVQECSASRDKRGCLRLHTRNIALHSFDLSEAKQLPARCGHAPPSRSRVSSLRSAALGALPQRRGAACLRSRVRKGSWGAATAPCADTQLRPSGCHALTRVLMGSKSAWVREGARRAAMRMRCVLYLATHHPPGQPTLFLRAEASDKARLTRMTVSFWWLGHTLPVAAEA